MLTWLEQFLVHFPVDHRGTRRLFAAGRDKFAWNYIWTHLAGGNGPPASV